MGASKAKILIVDDNQDILDLLSHGFKRAGYEVTRASSGNQAFLKTKSETFDLVLCDVQMPDGTGVDFIKQIKDAGITIPIFLFTADQTFDRTFALAIGAREVFRKPVTADNLIVEINRVLAS